MDLNHDDANGTWPGIYFLREDLKKEKMQLVNDMRDISLSYWAGSDPMVDELLRSITIRVEEINLILQRVETGHYRCD